MPGYTAVQTLHMMSTSQCFPETQLSSLLSEDWNICLWESLGSDEKKLVLKVQFNKQNHSRYHKACVLSYSVVSNCLWLHGLQPARLLCPSDSPSKNTGIGCQFILQGIFWIKHLSPVSPALTDDSLPLVPFEKHQTRLCTKSNIVGDSIPTEPRSKKKQGQELHGGRELGLELAKS